MPHIHGVAWIEKEWLQDFGINGELLENPEKAAELADQLLSCQLPECPKLRKIVEEVQVHHHTKSCMKYGEFCRYSYPKLPSPKTLIAQPLDKNMDPKQREKLLDEAKETLSKARVILESPRCNSLSFEEFLTMLEVTEEKYLQLISISDKGNVLVLKRSIQERFVNNYNPEMLTSWNANMDIQLALDPYAIITYIVSYVSKDETGMTKFLQEALKACVNKSIAEILKALKIAFLTHRQMGLSEAVYKVLPSLHLVDGNITCIFVATGFPENRSCFFRKVSDENPVEEEDVDMDQEEERPSYQRKSCKIEGRVGTYEQSIGAIDRYIARPKELEKMCLAQFATHYTFMKSKPQKAEFNSDGVCKNVQPTNELKLFNSDIVLPRYISLEHMELGFMRLRGFPAVMRIHSSKKKEGHEKHYSEMVLFCHFRNEVEDFHRFDTGKCIKTYEEKRFQLDGNRKLMFPGEATLDLMTEDLFDNEVLQNRPCHIYDALNSQAVQENEDDRLEGEESDPHLESFGYLGNLAHNSENVFDDIKFKAIGLPDEKELKFLTRRLVPEQRMILKKVVSFCKRNDETLRIIIHGGSGEKN